MDASPRALDSALASTRIGTEIFLSPVALQMTSLLLHWMPALVVWTLRWYPHRSVRLNFEAKSADCKADWHHGSIVALVLIPILPYLAWAVAYYVKVLPFCDCWGMVFYDGLMMEGRNTICALV